MKVLPRYLYHFTSVKNKENILKNGIKASFNIWDEAILNPSVFMVDFENFARSWASLLSEGFSLQSCLIFGQALRDGAKELSCFKISTKNLTSDIFVRSQKFFIDKKLILPGADILAKPSKYKLYQRNNTPIEYIHEGDILPSAVNCIGSVKVPSHIVDLYNTSPEVLNKASLSMLKKMFINQKEINALIK